MASAAVCYSLASASTSLSSSPLAASSTRVSDAAPTIVSVAPQVGYGSLKGVGLRSNNKAKGFWNFLSWVRSEQRGGEAGGGVGASGRSVEQSLGHNGDLRSTSTSNVVACAHIIVLFGCWFDFDGFGCQSSWILSAFHWPFLACIPGLSLV